jgi:hypothetical protein
MRFDRDRDQQLFEPTKIDLVAEAADGTIELIIIGDRQWTGTDAQLESFQDKIQTYVSFALDGQLVAQFPEAEGRPWRIVASCQSGPPDHRTQHVLDHLMERLPAHGGAFVVR